MSLSDLSEDGVPHKQGELIVRFVDTGMQLPDGLQIDGPLSERAIRSAISDSIIAGAYVHAQYDSVVRGLALVKLPAWVSVTDAVVKFNSSPNVLYAEPNYKIRALVVPNDPRFIEQWGMDNTGQTGGRPDADIDAPEAWDIHTGSPEIVVAVTDTGIDYNHPDLIDNIWINPGEVNEPGVVDVNDINDVDDDGNGYNDDFYGYDFVDDDADPIDENYHGTHVAGIIGAIGNNETGVAGVCWNVKLMALRILDPNGEGDVADAIAAIQYATTMDVNVINASWGTDQYQQGLYDAILAAAEAGIFFVAAAGNYPAMPWLDNDFDPVYPASYDVNNVISVMATNHFDNMASFSHYGPTSVDLGAPGEGILSTTPTYETDAMQADGVSTDYDYGSGTSASAPHVAGACALLTAINPNLTHIEVIQLILGSVDPVLPGLCVSGGRLNLFVAAHMARPGVVLNTRTHNRYPSIQEAIDAANSGDALIADANHWYIETISYRGKMLTLRSGDVNDVPGYGAISPQNTYISGLFDGGTVVSFVNGEAGMTFLWGFTITDGDEGIRLAGATPQILDCIVAENAGTGIYCYKCSPQITRCEISSNSAMGDGAGIYCENDSSPNIIDCTITANSAGGSGAGIYCDSNSSPEIDGCTISGNTSRGAGGGIHCVNNSDPNIINCTISANASQWEGGGIYCRDCSPVISDCTIRGNMSRWDGGGIYCDAGSDPNIRNCEIRGNIAEYDGGAIYCNGVSPLIKNCLIVDNSVDSWDGGGIFCADASPTITNCTMVRNSANAYDGMGGAVYCGGTSSPVIINCIFTDSKGYAVYEEGPTSDPNLTYCLFFANPNGDYYDADTLKKYDANSYDPNGSDPNNLNFIPDGMARDNLGGNPMFVPGRLGEYYLSNFAAGQILDANGDFVDPNVNPQDATSPAVDAGSADANSLEMNLYSTRTDNVADSNIVDIGYHYVDPDPAVEYRLNTAVAPPGTGSISPDPAGNPHTYPQYAQVRLDAQPNSGYQLKSWTGTDDDTSGELTNVVTMDSGKTVTVRFETILVTLRTRVRGGNGTVRPRDGTYPRGTVVELTATPANPAHYIKWYGTDNDFSYARTNIVTMTAPFLVDPQGREYKEVEVEFYSPRTLAVPEDYPTLQAAIDDAYDRDIIVLAPASQPYRTQVGYEVLGKAITITSSNPDDPAVVASTVIEQISGPQGGVGGAFIFYFVNPDTILNGITIRGFTVNGLNGLNGDPGADPPWWDGTAGSDMYGGGILCLYASPTIKNCVITDCTISGGDGGNGGGGNDDHPDGGHGGMPGRAYGAGMACVLESNPIVMNCTFADCVVIGGNGGDGGNADNDGGYGGRGGGWYYPYAPYTPYEWGPFAFFTEYSGRGGAVYVDQTSSPTFVACTFENNRSEGGTCGICGQNQISGLRLEPSIHWKIDTAGGAVYIGDYPEDLSIIYPEDFGIRSEARFISCLFNNNVADTDAPADNDDIYVSYGGAVAFSDYTMPTFENCLFNDNLATVGGGMYGEWAEPLIADSTFVGNRGYRGGGACIVGGSSQIVASTFNANQTISPIDLMDPNDPNFPIDPNLFPDNLGQGGAIDCFDADLTIVDCNILNNDAEASGGGVFISGSGTPLVKNCLITNNFAGRDGGGVSANWYSETTIANCTIAGNAVAGYGGGLYCSYGSWAKVINSILWGNYGFYGPQVAVGTGFIFDPRPADVNVLYSDIQDGARGAFVDTACTLNWGAGSINASPIFVTGPLGGYYLAQAAAGQPRTSPCVDAGSTYADSLGFGTYTTRTDHLPDANVVDMGYHRPLFIEEADYSLTLIVVGPGTVAVEPNVLDPTNPAYDPNNNVFTYKYHSGTRLVLTATPEEGQRVRSWTGTDRDPSWNRNTNTVVLYSDRTVIVEFEPDITRNLLVPSQYRTIEEAVAAAGPGGTNIIVSPGVHYVGDPEGIDFRGKSLTLISTDPDDPVVIAATIIDCRGTRYAPRRAFHFHSSEDPNAVVAGFTIRNGFAAGAVGINGGIPAAPVNPLDNNSPIRQASGTDASGIGYGGAILCENASSPTIRNCVISNCTVVGAYGGDGFSGAFRDEDSDLDGEWGGHGGDGTGIGYGGAMACLGGSSPSISDCIIKDNIARGGSGGNGGNGSLNLGSGRESWGGNGGYAVGDGIGGALYCEGGSNPAITDCNFINNIATTGIVGTGGIRGDGAGLSDPYPNPAEDGIDGGILTFGGIAGGAAYYDDSDANFAGCEFSNNEAYILYRFVYTGFTREVFLFYDYTRGGALYSTAGNEVVINESDFRASLGGAIYCEPNCAVSLENCSFEANTDAYEGGAVYLGRGGYLDVSDCNFMGNAADSDGGGIRSESDVNFVNCLFGGNRSGDNGGAIDLFRDTGDPGTRHILQADFVNCVFTGNEALLGDNGWGGGVHFQDFNSTFAQCYFIGNSAKSGGGLFLASGKVALIETFIDKNHAFGGSSTGLAIDPLATPGVGLGVTELQEGGFDIGGGLVCANTEARLEHCQITGNVSDGVNGTGGGIYFASGFVDHVLKNCLLTDNYARTDGGAVSASLYATPKMENCTFSANKAGRLGSAIFCDWSSDPAVINSIVHDCNSVAIAEEDFAKPEPDIEHTLFYANSDGDLGVYNSETGQTDVRAGTDIDATNMAGAPLFVTGVLGDFYLSQIAAGQAVNSPAVDAGSTLAFLRDLSSYTTRTDGARDTGYVDLGYHYGRPPAVIPEYTLTLRVIQGHGTLVPIDPEPIASDPANGKYTFYGGALVTLEARPESGWRLAKWSGTINDASKQLTNVVILGAPKVARVSFDQPKTLDVPGDYTDIFHAIEDANDGDVIIIAPGLYTYEPGQHPDGDVITIDGKAITITSRNPDDPNVVASTVIDGRFVVSNVGRDMVFNGLTIRNSELVEWDMITAQGPGVDGTPGICYDGGGMELVVRASPTVLNCIFDRCYVWGANGSNGNNGVDGRGSPGNGGWAGWAHGGAVSCGNYSNPIFKNCSFTGCWARGGDAGNGGNDPGGHGGNWEEELWRGTSWIWDYGPFDSYWKYSGYGGAIYCYPYSAPEFEDCTFIDNHTYGGSCGITGQPYTETWPLNHYKIDSFGGAVYAAEYSSPSFTGCLFSGNEADIAGPTNHDKDDQIPINYDPYISYGGAIAYEDGAAPMFKSCVFNDNLACIGGGIWGTWSDPAKVYDCGFADNSAFHGGGVYFVGGTVDVTGSDFSRNQASFIVIDVNDVNDPNAVTTLFGAGGAIYSFDALATIFDCNVSGNNAEGSGGGLYLSGSNAVQVKNCLVTRNSAGRDGGGISTTWHAEPTISNCTIAENVATGTFGMAYGGGLYCSYDSNTVVTDSIIWNNVSNYEGSQVAVGSGFEYGRAPSTLRISYSDIEPDPNMEELGRTLDIVLLIDSTGSMWDDIGAVKASATEIVGLIADTVSDWRMAVVDYKDFNDPNLDYGLPDDYPYRDVVPFTNDVATIVAGIDSIQTPGGAGGDWRESVYAALMHCIDGTSLGGWRAGTVTRVILLLADAPPHDPELPTGYTFNTVVTAASALPSKRIFPVLVGSDPTTAVVFRNLATATASPMLEAETAEDVVDAIMTGIDLLTRRVPSIYLEQECQILWWDPDSKSWDAGSHNIALHPGFTAGYYLSQTASGQPFDSPCVDAGSADANVPRIGLDTHTTRTDGVGDSGTVDMGYHYRQGLTQYRLTVTVIPDANGVVRGYVDPNVAVVYEGDVNNVVTVTAVPDDGYKVKKWTGTDNDTLTSRINTVTLTEDKHVTIEFEPAAKYSLTVVVIDRGEGPHGAVEPNSGSFYDGVTIPLTAIPESGYAVKTWFGTDNDLSTALNNSVTISSADAFVTVEFWQPVPEVISVPGDHPTIQQAVSAAKDGDTIVVDTGTYYGGYLSYALIVDKSVVITSRNPDDPCTVAATIIDGYLGTNPWHNLGVGFTANADANTVLNGFTIQNCGGEWDDGDDGDRDIGHPNGEDGACGEGAAIIIEQGASPVIKNCVIRNNIIISGDGGNGVDADENNNAGRGGWSGWARGAGAYCGVDSSPKFINCTFENNLCQGGNGGIGGNFDENGGYANYGGNYSRAGALDVSTEPNSLALNQIEGDLWEVWEWDLAPIYWPMYGEPTRASYFGDYRWYSGYGGAVFCDMGSNVTFVHCKIRGNSTKGGMSGQGGEITDAGRQMEPLVPYEIPSYGGGVYCAADTSVAFTACSFEGNIASGDVDINDPNHRLNPYLGYGGGVSAERSASVVLVDCNFVDNQADSGGGIYVNNANATIIDCNLVSNIALRGGGLLGMNGKMAVKACTLMTNEAAEDVNDPNDNDVLCLGAGIGAWSIDAHIADCNLSNNLSSGSGGGIYMRGGNNLSIANCLIRNNYARRDGGGISTNWYAEPTITNCTFVGNASAGIPGDANDSGLGGGLYCGYKSKCAVTDSIFWNNWALKGTDIAVGTGFQLDPICGTAAVSYCDFKPEPNNVWVDTSCVLKWGKGNIDDNPLFVEGPLGEYYLSQIAAGQGRNSPCVDAGSAFASTLGMVNYTTRTDEVRDKNTVDMGYHYPVAEPCRFCDLLFDGIIEFGDFALLASAWLDEGCSDLNAWCLGADITLDRGVGLKDLLYFAECWLVEDVNAPIPNPSEWEKEPHLVSATQISMTAETSYDAWGWDVEYFFKCVQGDCHDSDWQRSPTYTDTRLASNAVYGYRVKARDGVGNETKWSVVRFAGQVDTTPPTPAPDWQVRPRGISPNAIEMVAQTAYDPSGVEYFFDCNTPGGHSSGWQDEPNYTDTGLDPNSEYCYRVRARDKSPNQNTTSWSTYVCASTLVPPDTTPPSPTPMQWDPNGTPHETYGGADQWDYYASMTAVVATDASGYVEYFFQCLNDHGFDSGWQTDNEYTVYLGNSGLRYRFRVKARDLYYNETGWSPELPTVP